MRDAWRSPWSLTVLLALAGCGAGGAEVRAAISPAEWTPARIVMVAPAVPGDAIPPSGSLPAGITRPTPEEAGAAVYEALRAALSASATTIQVTGVFTRSGTAAAADRACRQYLETRSVDPSVGPTLAEDGGADAVLLTAVIRYGPEAETEVSTQAASVNTKVGTTDVGISSAATRVMLWYNAHIRCALVRVKDGAVVWDAGVRRRQKPGVLREVSQASVLEDTIRTLCGSYPWKPPDEEVGPQRPLRDEPSRPAPPGR
ncbi:MAG: hypothetical protein AAB152_15050 [Candidatus Coatesbacteria bacterium]